MSKDVIDKILSPTEISRQCPYLKFKEYEHLREEPREIYLSSAYYKSSWMWDEIRLAVSKYYNKGIEEAIFSNASSLRISRNAFANTEKLEYIQFD